MICKQCGAELCKGTQSCSACRTLAASDPPTPPLFHGIVDPEEKLDRRLFVMALMAGAIACLLLLFFLLGSDDKKNHDNLNGPDKSNSAPSAASTNAPSTSPSLHFNCSGRLPITLHGLRVGVTVEEAMNEDPTITALGADKGSESRPATKSQNGLFTRGNSDSGFYEVANFQAGKLIDILSTVSGLSPEDASEFNQNTLQQLGPPDVRVYAGPSTDVWVWIDGDVRIRYTNGAGGSPIPGSRMVSAEIAVYPEIIKGETSADNASGWSGYIRHWWGDKTGDVVTKQLPTELSGLKLRMTPQQVRSALPGIELFRTNAHRQQGNFQGVDVVFWDGLLDFFDRNWDNVPDDQTAQIRQRLMGELGTPSEDARFSEDAETLTWEDGHTKIVYIFGVSRSGTRGVTVMCWDERLQAASDAADAEEHPPQFKPAPDAHSFF